MKLFKFLLLIFFFGFSYAEDKIYKESIDCERLAANLKEKDLNKVYLPHESNCEKFYQCGKGGANEFHCGENLTFKIRTKECGNSDTTKCVLLAEYLAKTKMQLTSFYYSDY